MLRSLKAWLRRVAYAIGRAIGPIRWLGKRPLVFRYADIVEILERDEQFTVRPIYAERMARTSGDFFLGMDASERYRRESGIVRGVVRPDDLDSLRSFVRRQAESLIRERSAAGHLDVVRDLTRLVPTRLCEHYLGVAGPDDATFQRWMRSIFWHLFINIDGDQEVAQRAEAAALELNAHVTALITQRKAQLREGAILPDDLLCRLTQLQTTGGESLDDEGVRRNINGLVLGAVDTTSKAVVHALRVILERPAIHAEARQAAQRHEMDALVHYAYEALRFDPFESGMVRFCATPTAIGGKTLPAGREVILVTESAMFDPQTFHDPSAFRIDRPLDRYLHFGHGMHQCFGTAINSVQIPELLGALLRLPGLRERSSVVYEGPFPDRYEVSFDV